ncbi:hypothetical protein FQN54_005522 [Arachnomyces sp. PD_36]|nr:hypothetical protein FQN54_005522 [Arachnomyces sp. PD_36]
MESNKKKSKINYSRPLQMTYLSCPDRTDTLPTVEAKMKAIDKVVADGRSVAVHTGYVDGHTMDTAEDVEKAVVSRELNATEKLQYTSWKDGSVIPGFNFERFRIDVTHDANAATRYKDMVEAMKKVWSSEKPEPANAAYISLYRKDLAALLFAVIKIEKAKKESEWGYPRDSSAMDKVEAETIKKVTLTASKVISEAFAKVRTSARHITESKNVLLARKRDIEETGNGGNGNEDAHPRRRQRTEQPSTLPRSRPLPQIPVVDLTTETPTSNATSSPAVTSTSISATIASQSGPLRTTPYSRTGSRNALAHGEGSNVATAQTTKKKENQASEGMGDVRPKGNYQKPSVRDASESEEEGE